MMADNRVRFRCYRCSQLLGVPRKRIGTVVNCPRCQAELEVPRPAEEAGAGVSEAERRGETGVGSESGQVDLEPLSRVATLEKVAPAIPEDLISLRPEDIRVEAEFAGLVVTTVEPAPPPPAPPSEEIIFPLSIEPANPAPEIVTDRPGEGPSRASGDEVRLPITVPPPLPAHQPQPEAILPPIAIEPPSIRPGAPGPHHVHEVVLHPAVVLAWSLLVLMALPLAFIAGLLIGHFLWKAP